MIYDVSSIAKKVEDRYITPSLGKTPHLAVILSCAPAPGEISYLKQICRFADRFGVQMREIRSCDPVQIVRDLHDYPCDGAIRISNLDKDVDEYIDEFIEPERDLDGACMKNIAAWLDDESMLRVFPCTALAAYLTICEHFDGHLGGMNIAVINRSKVVGKPLAALLGSKRANATVHVMHSKSLIDNTVLKDMKAVVTAVGKPGWFTFDSMRENAFYKPLVVDVGVSSLNGKVVGDVDDRLERLEYIDVARSLGKQGIGNLTTTILFAKLFGGFECATWL